MDYSIADLIADIQVDEEAKKVFLAMPREEQLLAILGMMAYLRAEMVIVKRDQLEFQNDLHKYRERREVKERSREDDVASTTQKIIKVVRESMAQRFDSWAYFRDRVLPPLLTAFLLGLMYLVFRGGP